MAETKPRIVVFAGPTATIMNSAPLITSNKARRRHRLPLRSDALGEPLRFDILRPQRLAKPVTVYVEQFSAHPLERDAAHLYSEPDGYLDETGNFHRERQSDEDVPVYEIELRPEDGLIPLPYMAKQQDGSPWEADGTRPGAGPLQCRQPFYPDASRIFEEIDRLGLDEDGVGNQLSSQADFDFIRVVPPAGYTKGLPAVERTDLGEEDILPERPWEDFFPYRPVQLHREPPRASLATVTNIVQEALASGAYRGGLWLEGSPFVEETTYWLNLLIDTPVPIIGCSSADFPHGVLGATGDRNLVDGVRYVCSEIWADEAGRDRIGAVLIQAEQIFAARDVQKVDARAAGYAITGGHGGIVGSMGVPGPPVITYLPVWRHTWCSEVQLSQLPREVMGVWQAPSGLVERVTISVKDGEGRLLGDAIPQVTTVKHARYQQPNDSSEPHAEVEILARIERNLAQDPLGGFVLEGSVPYGSASQSIDAALRRATFSGMPVVRVGRGNPEGFVAHERVKLGVAGANLTGTKARLLLMACLLKFGCLPPAADPDHPTKLEVQAVEEQLARYQAVFDTH